MLKHKRHVPLTFVLFVPFSAQAYHDWSFINPKSLLDSQISFNTVISPSFLAIKEPASSDETHSPTEPPYRYSETEATEPLVPDTFFETLNSNSISSLLSRYELPAHIDDVNDLYGNSGSWIIEAYFESIRKKSWNKIFVLPQSNISPTSEAPNSSETITPVSKTLSGVLLILALIGWLIGRRLQNWQLTDEQISTVPHSQRFPRGSL